MQLTQKETDLIKDLKNQEKLCVDKYTKYSSEASDAQLKKLFSQISQEEQQHLNTISQIESGTVPQGNSGSSGQTSFTPTATYGVADNKDKQGDSMLCSDVLSSEKHVSHLYDTCVFEFKDENLRNTLNHIQKEEQEHGKMIYDYMQTNGMYS